jgi:hypothetical protein
MNEEREERDGSVLDAIETVANEGLKRNRLGGRLIRFWLLAGVAVVVAGFLLWWINQPAKLTEVSVAVLLPEMEKGSVAENAARQWAGFSRAFKKHGVKDKDLESHRYNFEYPIKEEGREAIKIKLKEWYKKGIRTFIITMSGATKPVMKDFVKWINGLPKNDRPVLIATVASAPHLVDRKNGVFRHYIRSKDESAVLATYIESINAQDVGIFYVNDSYGVNAKDILKNRILTSKDTAVYPKKVNLGKVEGTDILNEEIDIPKGVDEFIVEKRSGKTAIAVIIGYGSMIAKTLVELNKNFEGEILVVSTFTEEDWRPTLDGKDGHGPIASRVRFVGPGTLDDDPDVRGVVFQFSYLTLDRALKCDDYHKVEDFWACWIAAEPKKDSTGEDWADVEFTEDGDSHISLRLLKANE